MRPFPPPCPHPGASLLQVEDDIYSCGECGLEVRRAPPACPECGGPGDDRTRGGMKCARCAYAVLNRRPRDPEEQGAT